MKLKLKAALGGPNGEYTPGDEIDVPDVAECQRLVLRNLATVIDPKEKLPALSTEERQAIVSGRVVVTRRLGVPQEDGSVNWKGKYRYRRKSDDLPKEARATRRKSMTTRPRVEQTRAYAPKPDAK